MLMYDWTVARALDGMLLLLKLARSVPAERNRPYVIQRPISTMPTGFWPTLSCITVFLWMNAGTIYGLPETMDERERAREPPDKCADSVDEN